jgi:hypothetical protein
MASFLAKASLCTAMASAIFRSTYNCATLLENKLHMHFTLGTTRSRKSTAEYLGAVLSGGLAPMLGSFLGRGNSL